MNLLDQSLEQELSDALPHLLRWAVKYETREYDAESLASDTIISFLEHPGTYDPVRGSLRNFLFSFLKNKAVDFQRGYNRAYRKIYRDHLRRRTRLFVMPDLDCAAGAEDLRKEIERQLATMSPRVAEIFRLFAFDGKGYREIAQITGTSVSNAKTAVHRARIRLQDQLKSA